MENEGNSATILLFFALYIFVLSIFRTCTNLTYLLRPL